MSTTLTDPKIPRTSPSPSRRSWPKRVMHLLRRGHLYFGLFLFPWAILYGVTAFLFNHPTVFPDRPTASFSRDALADTPLGGLPSPDEQAQAIIAALNDQQKPKTPYKLGVGEARYATRDFLFATVRADARTFSVVYYVKGGGATIRETNTAPSWRKSPAPFATGKAAVPRPRGMGMGMNGGSAHNHDGGLKIEMDMVDRFKAAVPILLERNGFPAGELTISSAPDLKFPVEAEGTTWTATYNPLTHGVTGTDSAAAESDLSLRSFLLRLHLAHGYSGEGTKWFWALIVDAMALTMCYWGLSGLLMWWQIKATRKPGLVILVLSTGAATVLGFSMHALLSQ